MMNCPTNTINARSIRQSCTFCRAKKIRCSGGLICTTCRTRSLNCIYTSSVPKGRKAKAKANNTNTVENINTKKNTDVSLGPVVRLPVPAQTDDLLADPRSSQSSNYHQPSLLPQDGENTNINTGLVFLDPVTMNAVPSAEHTPTTITLGDLLESRFDGQYRHCSPYSYQGYELDLPSSSARGISYKDLFFNLTPALLDLLSARIGRLRSGGESAIYTPHGHHLRNCLAGDSSESMFDNNGYFTEKNVTLPSNGSDQTVCQMLEVWFSQHPVSLILSKTVFLHDFRGGLYDPGLLAIIIADVTSSTTLQHPSEWAPPESLRQFAREQVRQRPADQTSLPTIQLLVLLGWHQLCTGEVRRGACYINMAHRHIGQWNKAQERRLGTQRMNGVDYAAVALELGYRIFWLTFAIELWIALQLENAPFEYPNDIDHPSQNLASPDISVSSVYQLDQSSGNVASLGAQEQFWRGFWPLSHICCTVGPVHALLPRLLTYSSPHSSSSSSYWGAEAPRGLHSLVNGQGSVSALCQTVRSILSEELTRPHAQMGNHPSEIITRIAYQLLNIHLLFPQDYQSPTESTATARVQPSNITTLVENTIQALLSFKHSLLLVEQALTPLDMLNGISPCSNSGLILASLDASSRALREILQLFDNNDDPDAKTVILQRQLDLAELSRQLYTACKHPYLRAQSPTWAVKQQLKTIRQRFERLSSCSMDNNMADLETLVPDEAVFDPLSLDDTMTLLDLEAYEYFIASNTVNQFNLQ